MWAVAFSAVIAFAKYVGRKNRNIEQRFLGLECELAARFGFLLAIPAVFASGLFSISDAFQLVTKGMNATGPQLLVVTVIAFVVGLAAMSWLLRFLVQHKDILARQLPDSRRRGCVYLAGD